MQETLKMRSKSVHNDRKGKHNINKFSFNYQKKITEIKTEKLKMFEKKKGWLNYVVRIYKRKRYKNC